VLDKTSFYARGGGQEPDHGKIAGFNVVDVNKHGNIIVHELEDGIPKEGETVSCVVDSKRREGITKHHTSTHILNSSSRNVLGSWVWQHSAFKEVDHARLDITHHSALTDDEVAKIEEMANAKVKENIPVTIENFDRGTAEQKYGFRIYQGGVVPVKSVRIVSIEDFDVEACGGTHVKSTKDIDLIKITRTKRIQDGVVRLEFVAGQAAYDYDVKQGKLVEVINEKMDIKEKLDKKRDEKKKESREQIPPLIEKITEKTKEQGTKSFTIDAVLVKPKESGEIGLVVYEDEHDEFFHITFGEKVIKNTPNATYCGIFEADDIIRTIVYSNNKAKNAGEIVKAISEILGGAGGGNPRFAQGGGKDKSKKEEAINKAKSMVLE